MAVKLNNDGGSADEVQHWYVLRDLRRPNARVSAYQELLEKGFTVFTPLRWEVVRRDGKMLRRQVPVISDLLFVNTTRMLFDPVVMDNPTLQYRYVKGGQSVPMMVRDADMRYFVSAVSSTDDARYYLPQEVTEVMYGRKVSIVGGPLDGYEGNLLKARGTRVRRLIVSIPGFITAAVEVEPDYIRLLD